jgi:hypothetical protein
VGAPRSEALLDAAHKRARPDDDDRDGRRMAPVALGPGADAGFRAPMAIAWSGC